MDEQVNDENLGLIAALKDVKFWESRASAYAERIKWHSDTEVFPQVLFDSTYPTAQETEKKYIRGNYRNITRQVLDEFFGVTNRIFNDQNYSIEYRSEDLAAYLENDYPEFGSLIDQFRLEILPKKILDPNGWVVLDGDYAAYNSDGSPDTGKKLHTFARFVHSHNQAIREKDYVVYALEEKSKLDDGKEGWKFVLLDTQAIYEYTQVGKQYDWQFALTRSVAHELGYLPVWDAGTTPERTAKGNFYRSELDGALPLLDDALVTETVKRISLVLAGMFREYEYSPEAVYADDTVFTEGENPQVKPETPTEQGTSPMRGKTRYNPQTQFESVPSPPMGFVQVPRNMFDFAREDVEAKLRQARKTLKLYDSNTQVKGSETALARMVDREEMFSFIKGISDKMYRLLSEVIYAIGKSREREYEGAKVGAPDEFSIKTSEDLTEEISLARVAGLPIKVLHDLQVEYTVKRFSPDDLNRAIIVLQEKADRLFALTNAEVMEQVAMGLAAKWEVILHVSFFSLVSMMPENFHDQEMATQVQQVIDAAKSKANEIAPPPPNVLETNV